MNLVRQSMIRIMQMALEDWGMMLAEPLFGDEAECEGRCLLGSMSFRGVLSGRVCILCPESFLAELCRNLLGADAEDEPGRAMQADALKELTNVVCGNFLSDNYGEDTVFELHCPEVEEADAELVEWFRGNRLIQYFDAEGCAVAVALAGVREA